MSDHDPRWDDPTFDNLKLDIMQRAWGDVPPDRMTFDVSSVPLATIQAAAAQLERTFFIRQAPHGSIEWTNGFFIAGSPHDDSAVLIIHKPDRALTMIIVGDRECRLVSYGKPYDAEKHQQTVGVDKVTIRSVDFVHIWGPKLFNRPPPGRHMMTSALPTVISTLPAPR